MSAKNNVTKISKFIQSNLEIDGIVITDPANLAYATGLNYEGLYSITNLIVIAFFSASKRFLACPKIMASAYQNAGWDDSIITYDNCSDPESAAAGISSAFITELFGGNRATIGFLGDRMHQSLFEKLTARIKSCDFIDISESFARLRQIKSASERRIIEKAAALTDHGIAGAVHHVSRNGAKSEKFLTEDIRVHCLERGLPVNGYRAVAQAVSEDHATILWPNAPYYAVGRDGNFFEGKFIRLEMTGILDGYWSTDSRMMVKGDMNPSQKTFAEKMTALRKYACSIIKPGAVCKDIFYAINKKAVEMGIVMAPEFGYGAGIGVSPVEPPYISAADETVIEKNMMIVLSLGARYTAGGGELYITRDTLRITDNGCEILGWYENWDYPYTAAYTF